MNSLINDNFLLENNAARELYNEFAKELPIVDYHCHIDVKEIAEPIISLRGDAEMIRLCVRQAENGKLLMLYY